MNLKVSLKTILICSALLNPSGAAVAQQSEAAVAASIDETTPAVQSQEPTKTESIEPRSLERLFQSTYFAHYLVKTVDEKIQKAGLSGAQAIAEAKQKMYWGVISDYRDWLQEKNVSRSAIEKLQAAYLSPSGAIFTRIMDPKYPSEPFQKAIIMTPVELAANAPAPDDVRALFDILYFQKVANVIIATTLKAYNLPTTTADIEKSYTNLIRATAATLLKEGLNKNEFAIFLKKFQQPEVRNIFTVLNDFSPDKLEKSLNSRLPSVK